MNQVWVKKARCEGCGDLRGALMRWVRMRGVWNFTRGAEKLLSWNSLERVPRRSTRGALARGAEYAVLRFLHTFMAVTLFKGRFLLYFLNLISFY